MRPVVIYLCYIAGMIYATGSISNPAGVSFRRDPGFRYWTVGVLFEGRIRTTYADGTVVRKGPGCLSVTPPDTPYQIVVEEAERELWIFCSLADPLQALVRPWPQLFPGVRSLPLATTASGSEVMQLLTDVLRDHGAADATTRLLAENSFERALLLADRSRPEIAGWRRDERVAQALAWLAAHFRESVQFPALAARLHLSPSRFSHLFRDQTGETPEGHLERLRLREAARLLLTTNLRIREVATASGFMDAFYFSARFRKHYGQSPRAYRQSPTRMERPPA